MKAFYVLLFLLILGIVLFQVLYDRIGALPAWTTPFWTRWKTPFIVVTVVAGLGLLLFWIRHYNMKRLQAAQAYAAAQGWAFSQRDELGIKEQAETIFYDQTLTPNSIRLVEDGERRLCLFDCLYKHRNATASVREHLATACLIASERFRSVPAPLVISEYLVINETLLGKEVELEDSPFSKRFVVRSMDPDAARSVLTPSLQAVVLEHKQALPHDTVAVALAPGGAVLMTPDTADPARWHDLIEFARRIESSLE